jgi:CubicO group peptidase (beta-lactamase class C family)
MNPSHIFGRAVTVVALIASPVTSALAQNAASPRWAPAVDSIIRAEMARAQTPGAQVAVVMRDRVVYTNGYGVSDIESGRPVSDKTLFQIGSLTKLTTAALLTQLAAEGKVDLNAPISRYIPGIAGKRVGSVTTHQLLSMTGGWGNVGQPNANLDEGRVADKVRDLTDDVLFTEPGAVYSYSNSGYVIAGHVAEVAAGQPFTQLRDSVVLRGLGMPRATARSLVAMTYDFALGHGGRGGSAATVVRPVPENGSERAAGFLWSSAAEAARVAIALMNDGVIDGKQVFAPAAMRAMTMGYTVFPASPRQRAGYWLVIDTVGGRRYWHGNGGVIGYQTSIRLWPDQKLAVVVTSNRANPSMAPPAAEKVGALLGGLAMPEEPVYAPDRDPTSAERAALIGRYSGGAGGSSFAIVETGGGLELQLLSFRYPVRLTNDGARIVIKRAATDDLVYLIMRDEKGKARYLHSNGRAFARLP